MSIFKPYNYTKYNWVIFDSLSNFLSVIILIFINQFGDLSNFFLKNILYIPSSHYILLIRALFLFGLCAIGFR